MEHRYDALLGVIGDGFMVTEAASKFGGGAAIHTLI
jgi:hypothetical protein